MKWLGLLLGLVLLSALGIWYVLAGQAERLEDGVQGQVPLSASTVQARDKRQEALAGDGASRILFGDVHVHTSISVDAFQWGLPMMGGEGVHPPADACDFARYCSQLDFFALTDHAEALTPRTWAMSKEAVRQCNAVADESEEPDLVAFTGFEWTQIGRTPQTHYGHKNIFFKNTGEEQLPPRPIATPGLAVQAFTDLRTVLANAQIPIRAFPNQKPYNDAGAHLSEIRSLGNCPENVPTRELPADCRELAATPADLFRRLDDWGFESFVVPHGTTWGLYTPPGYSWDKQIAAAQDDPRRQRFVEVFSGHGNSEEYRSFRALDQTAEGETRCPEPSESYEPCCWRAGEIIRGRCDDPSSDECEQKVDKARRDYLAAGVSGHLSIPGADIEEWGDCGECRDCFNPSFSYRPAGSVQYMLARGNFEDPGEPRHMTLGFIASSDNHSARPGTGYKELARRQMTDARGPISPEWKDLIWGAHDLRETESRSLSPEQIESTLAYRRLWFERQASFFLTGGLVAVHARERSREGIWQAMHARNVYGTSGDRILLWFDMLNAPGGEAPMGSSLVFSQSPKFRVRAAGAFEQLPGCSDEVLESLGAERVARVCAGECYRPSDERRAISRIEVVRIVRQGSEDEPIEDLIEDPWLTLPCTGQADLCEVEFEDPWYVSLDREVLYYVRAIQEPTPAINAAGARCADAECKLCFGDYRSPADDDCLSMNEERAWSSPIYLSRMAAP